MKKMTVLFLVTLTALSARAAGPMTRDAHEITENYELDAQGIESVKYMEAHPEIMSRMIIDQTPETQTFHDLLNNAAIEEDLAMNPDLIELVGKCVPTAGRVLMGCCNMYVRLWLDAKGLIPNGYSLGIAAANAGSRLTKVGYCNVIEKYGRNPRKAPEGALMVYSGGPYGHIEVKAKGGYYFGPLNAMPATEWSRTKRNLTGIYEKCR